MTRSILRTRSASACQSRMRAGAAEIVACDARLSRRLRNSPSKPFMIEMIVISAATPTQMPSIEIQLMNETKKPRLRLRT